jgi:hypothetical protein
MLVFWCHVEWYDATAESYVAYPVISSFAVRGVHYSWYVTYSLITVATWDKTWTVFGRSNTGVVGSNPTRGRNACMFSSCICVQLCDGVIHRPSSQATDFTVVTLVDPGAKGKLLLCLKHHAMKVYGGPGAAETQCSWILIQNGVQNIDGKQV